MNKRIIRIIVAAVLLAVVYALERWLQPSMGVSIALYAIPYLIVGAPVLAEAWEGITEGDPFNEDLLMSIATLGALFIGLMPGAEPQMPEAVFVMLFFQVGEVFEDKAEDNSRRSISKLMDIRPDTARMVDGDATREVPAANVKVDSTIEVRPGETIPLDGVVLTGSSSLNTVALTGESLPRGVQQGSAVASGCVNLEGVLHIKVTKVFGESTASKIINLVENAQNSKSKSETFVRRFAHVYTPVVVFAAIALAIIPPLVSGNFSANLSTWLLRALTFLVVSCPCALVISVPLSFFGGIGGASRKGILIKGGNYIDTLARLRSVVFDKTGTLTRGVFAVEAIHPDMMDAPELLHLAAHVEQFSSHPIAAALRQAWHHGADSCTVDHVTEVAGHGIKARVNDRWVWVGNERMMQLAGATITPCKLCGTHTGTVVHVSVEGRYAGHIIIADQIKPDARTAVSMLRQEGVGTVAMLTGDRAEVAQTVAAQIGINNVKAELLPADKLATVEQMMQQGHTPLAFVGDGINDAPVLARADVGIAMGALGSDAAIQAADVVIMDDKPSKVALAIRIARRTRRIASQNAWGSVAVKVAVLVLAAVGLAGMPLAVFADVGVMVLAVLNAGRTLMVK